LLEGLGARVLQTESSGYHRGMRAFLFGPDGPGLHTDYPAPEHPDGEALIPVVAGVCTASLELVEGNRGFTGVLSHEFVVVVEEADVWHHHACEEECRK